jgi:small subunit ribosomal protein S16
MLAISLMRMGAKGNPFYRLVVKEKRSKRDGKYLENVGTYNPMLDPAEVLLNHDRINYWIGVGAQPSDTVKSLIKNNPVQTEEEKAAASEARAAKKAADDQARADAIQAENERLAAEKTASEPSGEGSSEQVDVPVNESEQANDPMKAPSNDGTEFVEASAVAKAEGGSTDGSSEEAKTAE